jgi:hypothetical protein
MHTVSREMAVTVPDTAGSPPPQRGSESGSRVDVPHACRPDGFPPVPPAPEAPPRAPCPPTLPSPDSPACALAPETPAVPPALRPPVLEPPVSPLPPPPLPPALALASSSGPGSMTHAPAMHCSVAAHPLAHEGRQIAGPGCRHCAPCARDDAGTQMASREPSVHPRDASHACVQTPHRQEAPAPQSWSRSQVPNQCV